MLEALTRREAKREPRSEILSHVFVATDPNPLAIPRLFATDFTGSVVKATVTS